MLNRLIDKLEKKCQRKMGGIPMLWVIYKPDKPVPNMEFRLHPMFNFFRQKSPTLKECAGRSPMSRWEMNVCWQ